VDYAEKTGWPVDDYLHTHGDNEGEYDIDRLIDDMNCADMNLWEFDEGWIIDIRTPDDRIVW